MYDCGFNAFHLLLKSSLMKAIPINEHAVMKFADDSFADANGVFPTMITTVVDSADTDVTELFGDLPCISPEEPRHAFIFKLAQRIKDGADEDELALWAQMALSVTVRISVVPDANQRLWAGEARGDPNALQLLGSKLPN